MKFPPFFLILGVLAIVASPVLCQELPHRLDEVVVTASRIESPLREAPANVTVITAQDIEETGAQTIADVVQGEPGVFTQNLLGNPKGANIDIRGYGETTPQNVLVLVNGRRINGIDLTGPDLSQIPVDAIERVEVYRGPGTVLYGDNAAGGVVDIVLKAGEGPPKATASTTIGSYNYFKPELIFSGKQGRLAYLATVSNVDTEGYRHLNQYYGRDALGNFKIDVFRALTFNLSAGHHKDNYGQPGALFWSDLRRGTVDPKDSTLSYLDGKGSTEDNFVDLEPELKFGEHAAVTLGVSYRNRHISSSFDYGSGDFFVTRGQVETYAFTPKAVISYPVGRSMKNILIVGSDWYKYPTTATSSTSFYGSSSLARNDVEKRDFAYYVTDRFYPLADLLLEAGYRRQRTTYDFENADLLNGITETGMSSRYDKEAYRFSASYSVLDKASVFASYSKAFRFPATDEFITWGYYDTWSGLFSPTQINAALKPQTTKEFDVGVRFYPWRNFSGAVTYFRAGNRDEIYFNPYAGFFGENQNYAKTRRQGVEASLFFNPIPGLVLNLAYSYTEALFDGGPFGRNRIPLVPRDKLFAKVSYSLANWDFGISSFYTGNRYAVSDQENAREKLPGYTTFDGSIGYRWSALSVLLAVKNITDKRYFESGTYRSSRNDIGLYPAAGRQFFLTVKYTLGG
jgi:iron complex outermembrane recepter protein